MTALATQHPISIELAAMDRRTRRMVVASVVVHAAALLLWLLLRQFTPQMPELIEVTWLEPEPVVVASALPAPTPAVAEPVEEPEPVTQEIAKVEERFERPRLEAPVAPAPQRPEATSDQLRATLDELRVAPPTTDLSRLATAGPSTPARPASIAAPIAAGTREQLVRGESRERPEPSALERKSTPVSPRGASLASVDIPRPAAPNSAPKVLDETVARRSIEGAMLMGEVADRPLLEKSMPAYPERARRDAVEATVTLRFVVLADGRVTPNVRVERSSGHADFDRNAIEALRTWRFAALPAGRAGEQWGAITFEFRLRDR